jgi:hypothetical protein
MTAFPRHPADRRFYATMSLVAAAVIVAGFSNTYGPMVLAGLMLATGLTAAIEAARAGHKGIPGVEFPTREGFLLLDVVSACVFSALVAAGWRWRRRPQAHKRLMLAATVAGLVPPGISRLPGVAGHDGAIAALAIAFLLVGPTYDLETRSWSASQLTTGAAARALSTSQPTRSGRGMSRLGTSPGSTTSPFMRSSPARG